MEFWLTGFRSSGIILSREPDITHAWSIARVGRGDVMSWGVAAVVWRARGCVVGRGVV